MKKFITLFLICALLVCLASCVSDDIDNSQESASIGDASDGLIDDSSETSEIGGEVSEDVSVDTSVDVSEDASVDTSEDVSEDEPDVDIDSGSESELRTLQSVFPSRAATGYSIVYTKESALDAFLCYTNSDSEITAIFDGSVTRFFDAITGQYYHAEHGEWTVTCCGGFYNVQDKGEGNLLRLNFEKDTDIFLGVEKVYHGHGLGYAYNFYSPINMKTYSYAGDEQGYELYECEGLFICIEMQNAYDAADAYLNGSFDFSKVGYYGKFGLTDGANVIIPFEYDYMGFLSEDWGDHTPSTVGVVVAVKDGRAYYFSTNGKNLTPDGFDCGSQPYGDRAWVFEDGQGWIIKFN